jgi:hypothetical protein
MVSVVDLEDNDSNPLPHILGHASIEKEPLVAPVNVEGSLVGCGNIAAVANLRSRTVLLFPIKELEDHPHLDRRLGPYSQFRKERREHDSKSMLGRQLAWGKLDLPAGPALMSRAPGGCIGPSVLAMRGILLVCGYPNGEVQKLELPSEWELSEREAAQVRGGNEYSSCSVASSGLTREGGCPLLHFDDYDSSDNNEEDDGDEDHYDNLDSGDDGDY